MSQFFSSVPWLERKGLRGHGSWSWCGLGHSTLAGSVMQVSHGIPPQLQTVCLHPLSHHIIAGYTVPSCWPSSGIQRGGRSGGESAGGRQVPCQCAAQGVSRPTTSKSRISEEESQPGQPQIPPLPQSSGSSGRARLTARFVLYLSMFPSRKLVSEISITCFQGLAC